MTSTEHAEAPAGATPLRSETGFDRDQRDLPTGRRVATRLSGEAPLVVFGAAEGLALVLWLAFGRFQWFHNDEWDFIAGRKAGDLGDLFRAHGGHWVTAPVLLYRLLFWCFGLRNYLPYRIPVLAMHLTAAALLVVVMRRAGVRPWIATAAGCLFLLLGTGRPDIIEPFQVCFTASLAFGLAHLLLADHDGPFGTRDWLGLLAGFVGLMCSGVALSMIVIVGVAVLLRRGWRLALAHTAPLAACYLLWFLAIGHQDQQATHATAHGLLRFITTGLRAADRSIVHYGPLTVALVIVLVSGFVFATLARQRSRDLSQLAAPLALVVGAIFFLATTAIGRLTVGGAASAGAGRYLYLVVAMMLPALAVAADALSRRWRWLLPVAIAVFLVGIPGNIRAGVPVGGQTVPTRRLMLTISRDPLARQVPRSIRPDPVTARPVTIGWLLDGVAQHRVPRPAGTVSKQILADNVFRLSFDQEAGSPPTTSCQTLSRPLLTTLKSGDEIGIYDDTVQITPAGPDPLVGSRLVFFPDDGNLMRVVATPQAVLLSAPTLPFNWRMTNEDTKVSPRVCFGR